MFSTFLHWTQKYINGGHSITINNLYHPQNC